MTSFLRTLRIIFVFIIVFVLACMLTITVIESTPPIEPSVAIASSDQNKVTEPNASLSQNTSMVSLELVTNTDIDTSMESNILIDKYMFREPPITSIPITQNPFREPVTSDQNMSADPSEPNTPIGPTATFSLYPKEVSVNVGDTFDIQIAVENVTDMYGWQVYVSFDPMILECVNASLPPSHVFSYAYTVCDALVDYNSSEFVNPLQSIRNDEGRVLVGNCLLGSNQSTFNGSGVLCQITFKAISTGSFTLGLLPKSVEQRFGTYVLNSEINIIPMPSVLCCDIVVKS